MRKYLILILVAGISLESCQRDDSPKGSPMTLPSNFPAPSYDLTSYPVTRAGFELGRKIFYDPILSRDSSTSCGSCHIQYSAFTHHGHIVSHGIDNRLGTRNALAVQNMAWEREFFWDGGVINLDLVPINAITSHVEMDESLSHVIYKMNRGNKYPALFNAAYGSPEITTSTLLKALSQFMLSLVSANSRYDKYIRNEGGVLNAQELNGLALFRQNCATCHATDLFTDHSYRNNGLNPNIGANDLGRSLVTLSPDDDHKFKVPSLRNVEKTAPYMHNGRVSTLEAVLEHYTTGIVAAPTLDSALIQADGSLGLPLSATDKQDIIAFLKTLTDEDFIRNTEYSEQ